MKNIINILLIFIIIFFIFLIIKYYLSDQNIKNMNINRNNTESLLKKKTDNLPILLNNTNNVIEFNSGFDDTNKNKLKRSFWDLFK